MTLPPAPRPCASCPYRQDVPSGVWSEEEYAKLPAFDGPTYAQPARLFVCHQHDRGEERARVCAGWAGCHDMGESLGVRVALASGRITEETAEALVDYVSPVPLFASGAEAAAHGMREVEAPGVEAAEAIGKIRRVRSDLT
ncbi:DUF6283 family protein [Streptomyces sp. A0642]|uniref:DUF6283 family protein n=1 Tax=Streptomyces sp. A0642 TaxID=2563100 RepID=UPI0023F2F36F|nr:DUF6283 family protein [Streptomyces sp. A0642]